MRICVFGAGAIGGLFAARLSRSGQQVSLVARAPTKEAIEREGLRVQDREGIWTARPARLGSARELGPQDLVILATKAHALHQSAGDLAHLLHEDTTVLTAVNGIPWWYFAGQAIQPKPLDSVDPGGVLWNTLEPRRAVGCLVHLGAASPLPGQIAHAYGNLLVIGEPGGGESARLGKVATVLEKAGFKVRIAADIHEEVWRKLLYNVAINPVSLVTGAPCDRICADPLLRQLLGDMMREAVGVASRQGVSLSVDIEEQVAGIARIGAFKTSMLQDHEAGRSVELDPVLGSVVELAQRACLPVPRLQEIYALARTRARVAASEVVDAAKGGAT